MHLFALGTGLTDEEGDRLIDELRRSAHRYPQLDHDGAWNRRLPGGIVVGGVSTPASIAAPRSYVHESAMELVLYDGLPLDPAGEFEAFRAAELGRHWDALAGRIEGRYIAVRVRSDGSAVEVLNDPFGVAQLYVAERDATRLISNSAGLLARALGDDALDPGGVSTLLVLGWVAGDRTLSPSVRTAPGGQHWTWDGPSNRWTQRRYWSYTNAGPPTRPIDDDFARELATALGGVCRAAASVTGSVNAPLTGGKDSRTLAAILMGHRVPTQWWTKGVPDSTDVQIASQVASRYNLPHRVAGRPTTSDRLPAGPGLDDWDDLTRQFVSQNDGLPHLALVGNLLGQPARVDRLAVTFSAMCGESMEKQYAQDYLDGPGASYRRAERYLAYHWAGTPNSLVNLDAHRMARNHVRHVVRRLSDEGLPISSLSLGVYLDERCRRWAPMNPRELAQTEDKVLPFLTRAWVEGALACRPIDRATSEGRRRVMQIMVPGIAENVPFDRPWDHPEPVGFKRWAINGAMSSMPVSLLSGVAALRRRVRPPRAEWRTWTPYDEAAWLEGQLGWAREICLGQGDSPLWAYVDRRELERLLDPLTLPGERQAFETPLYSAIGLFLYQAVEREQRVGPAQPSPPDR